MRLQFLVCYAAGALAIGALACGSPGSGGGSATSTGGAPSVQDAASSAASGSTETTVVNLEELFPQGHGRDDVLENCGSCHGLAPILVLQMDEGGWNNWQLGHRERVSNLSDEQFQTLRKYLSSNFGPDHPVPKLPPELLKGWTSY